MLLGREKEQRSIEDALGRARHGAGAALLLIGEPGIGKSALLDHAARQADGMTQLRARGLESEARIPFAGLLELLRPALAKLPSLPRGQADALEAALALRPAGESTERFAVGAATLSLLAAYADDGPLVVIIDDAHWLDRPSSEAILFALRRMTGDPVAALIAARSGADSALTSSDLPTLPIEGLEIEAIRALVPDLSADTARRLHRATAGNPLAALELAGDAADLLLGDEDSPVPVPERVAAAYVSRLVELAPAARRILCLLAVSGTEDLAAFNRAAARLDLDVGELAAAEAAGLITLLPGDIRFRHPLARSAVYSASDASQRRDAHRALADVLPDRDFDRRAWHLAAAAIGLDESASEALEQAGRRSRERSAYATASAAFARAARLTADSSRAAGLLLHAAETAWHGGLTERACTLLAAARAHALSAASRRAADELSGRIAIRCGPIMGGYEILISAAAAAPPEQAVAILADAACACFYGASPQAMLEVGRLAQAALPTDPSPRMAFLAAAAGGMAEVLGGDAGAGMRDIHRAIAIAERSPELSEDLSLLPWLATAPLFLRDSAAGRGLFEPALMTARARSALSTLPFVLNLRAREHATTARWSDAEVGYLESMNLARETEQLCDLSFALRPGHALCPARPRRRLSARGHGGDRTQPASRGATARGLGHRRPG